MRGLLRRLRHSLLKLRGIDPQPVIATLWLGPEAACTVMERRMREMLPHYRHITVRPTSRASARHELAAALRRHRIGMVAALPDGWSAALATAPLRTMAFNAQLDNWFITWRDPISSVLFLRGKPIDRIKLRPWFWPFAKPRTVAPTAITVIEGRPAAPHRAPFNVLTPYLPWPLSHGGAVRIYSLLREAARHFDIHLYAFVEDKQPPDLGPLLDICHRITYVEKPHYREPRWSKLLPPEVGEYESPAMRSALLGVRPLQVEYTQLAAYGGDILVEHDVTFDLYTQVHAQQRSLTSWWNLYRWKRFERAAVRTRRPVVMSPKDASLLAAPNAVVIGNGVDLDRFTPTPEHPGRRLLFVGSFRHFPNVGAFQWFWREVWPLLNDCHLTVVAGPDPEYHWRTFTGEDRLPQHPSLDLRGFVADVKPLYDEANVVVVPTLVSAGTNLKVLEAMAMCRAVVSTPSGIGGIDLKHGESVMVADSPAAFARHIHALLADDTQRAEIAHRASAIAQQQYSWRSLGKIQADLWHTLSPSPVEIVSGSSTHPDFADYPAWLARLNGQTLAELVWRRTAEREHELLWIETGPAHRRLGLAERLLTHAITASPGEWFLEVRASNTSAQALYRKLGFTQIGLRRAYYSDPDEDALVMKRG